MKNIVAANWKMNFDIEKAQNVAKKMAETIDTKAIDVVVCPPFTHLDRLEEVFSSSVIKLGAQNMYFEEKGAFTGEISPAMLQSIGCEYVILGHSERRHIFYEDDELINKKVKSAKKYGFNIILCVGETLKERKNGRAFDVVKTQLQKGLDGVDRQNVIVAYEPVWAIGTGVSADRDTIEEIHKFIRQAESDVPILYGGSVKAKNAAEIAAIGDVNGFLVGSASLDADEFKKIIDEFIKTKGV